MNKEEAVSLYNQIEEDLNLVREFYPYIEQDREYDGVLTDYYKGIVNIYYDLKYDSFSISVQENPTHNQPDHLYVENLDDWNQDILPLLNIIERKLVNLMEECTEGTNKIVKRKRRI